MITPGSGGSKWAATALTVCVLTCLLPRFTFAFGSFWTAESGRFPDDACPPWRHVASAGTAVLAGDTMTLSTQSCSDNQTWLQMGTELSLPAIWEIEFGARFVAGGFCGPCGPSRRAIAVGLRTAPQRGADFLVGEDEIFLMSDDCDHRLRVVLPTTDRMHTYRLEVAAGGGIDVFYDDSLVITGGTYFNSNFGDSTAIVFGEASSAAFGTAKWSYFRHNGHANPCPSSSTPATFEATDQAVAFPMPFDRGVTVRWGTSEQGDETFEVSDLLGRRITSLAVANDLGWGGTSIHWDGTDDRGRPVANGVYFVSTLDHRRHVRVIRMR